MVVLARYNELAHHTPLFLLLLSTLNTPCKTLSFTFDCETNFTLLDHGYFGKGNSKTVWRAKAANGQEFVLKRPVYDTPKSILEFWRSVTLERNYISRVQQHSSFPETLIQYYGLCKDTNVAAVEGHLTSLHYLYQHELPVCYGLVLLLQLLRLNSDLDKLGLIHCDPKAGQLAVGLDLKLRLLDLDSIQKIHHPSCGKTGKCAHTWCLQARSYRTTDSRCENGQCVGFDGKSALQTSFITTSHLFFGANMSRVADPELKAKLQRLYFDSTVVDRSKRITLEEGLHRIKELAGEPAHRCVETHWVEIRALIETVYQTRLLNAPEKCLERLC
eukprot:m.70461 g.70461  ORF g.70461 m.70461 type:complete len:331 (-) comp14164_c0_seq2:136-1128(-)